MQSKICPICEQKFFRPKGKSDVVWMAQKCCGRACSAIFRRKDDAARPNRRKELIPGTDRFDRGSRKPKVANRLIY